MQPAEPLILTLKIDAEAQAMFNNLRRQYFPPERNFIDAHLTLFHHLPAGESGVFNLLDALSSRQQSINICVSKVVTIGNGVAYKCESAELQDLHKHLQQQWAQWLIPQDRQKLWPHITIQNKVNVDVARATLNELSAKFAPFNVSVTGLSLWKYLGGPWEFVSDFLFK